MAETVTADPGDPRYLDEADTRAELARVFDVCGGCRRCVDLCPSFPTLFELLDRLVDGDAGRMTPAQQDRVVEECFHCSRCSLACPYVPARHELNVDVPRLMLRAEAMRRARGHLRARRTSTDRLLGRVDLLGRVATRLTPLANRVVGATAGSPTRTAVAAVTGVSAVRLLPPYARERFSTWFRRRPQVSVGHRQGRVTVFPTCLVEYHEPAIGKDLVRIYERNGIECTTTAAGCCGAPSLHAGDVARFAAIARRNVRSLAAGVRAGTDIVVPQPTCGYVLKHEYPRHLDEPDARLVAERTYDAAEYLMRLHRADDTVLDTDFAGTTSARITCHAPCHLRAQEIGVPSRDLLKLTGARVEVVHQCSGMDGAWGVRAENEHRSIPVARRLGVTIEQAAGDAVAGDCHLANTAIAEQTGSAPQHPLQLLARAYGIAAEG